MEREKITKSGKLLEADFFPVLSDGRRMLCRPKATKPSSIAQAKYNNARAIKNSVRLINANFGNGDLWITVTYSQKNAPETIEEAGRDMVNYLRRVKRARVAELKRAKTQLKEDPQNKRIKEAITKLSAPFKYYYAIEEVNYQTGDKAGKSNFHFHLFMTGGLSRDDVECLWAKGARVSAERFRPEEFGPEAAARYTAKDPKGRKRFRHSKNLDKPVSRSKDGKISARGVERLTKERIDDKEYWENRYKGYRFIRCFARFNKYNKHWYLSVVMYKTENEVLPDWNIPESEWVTEGVV